MTDQTSHLASLNIACFVTSFLLEGLQRCSGIFFNGTLEITDEDRQTAAIPFIVSRATAYVISVVFKNLIQKQKLEVSLLFGTLLCALGAGLSFVSNDVLWLSITWGVIFGTGFGIVYPENLKVSQKFRSQTLIPVLYSAASSFACIILPFLMQYLFCRFGLSGCFLILSGVILNAIPFILTAIYKIRFHLWKLKWRIRKKYDIKDIRNQEIKKEEPKIRLTHTGFDNAGFEYNDFNNGLDKSNSFVFNRPETENKDSCRDLSTIIDHQTEVAVGDIILEHDSEKYHCNTKIPKCRKDSKIIIKNQTAVTLFEKDINEEDTLFDLDSLKGQLERSIINRNESFAVDGASCSMHSKHVEEGSPNQNKKHSLVNVTDYPKHVEDSSMKKNTSAQHSNTEIYTANKDNGEISVKNKNASSINVSLGNMTCNNPPSIQLESSAEVLSNVEFSNAQENASAAPLSSSICDLPKNTLDETIPTIVDDENNLTSKSQILRDFPLEIRVHVVECTFTSQDLIEGRLYGRTKSNAKRNGYRRHSNSLITSHYENIDFTSPHFLKKCSKSSKFNGCSSNPTSKMYLISEDEELGSESNNPSNSGEILNETPRQSKSHISYFEPLKKLFKPSCLVIIYGFVIHEITLVTLLLTFDDHLTDIEKAGNDATSVLSAFGLGGILGRLSVRYCGDKLLQEGSNAAAALLFILEGGIVVGILLSTNMYWIGTFYAILGFLEIGISTAIWNLVKDYIEVDSKTILFTTCTLVCGVSALFVPYTIGLTRDDLGEYDGLLQITSGLSVLCAILCYVLPKFVYNSRHDRGC